MFLSEHLGPDLTATTSPSQNQPQLVSASCLHVNKHGVWSAECDTCDHTVNSICVCLSPLCNWLNLKYLQRFQLPKPNEIHNWARGTHTQLRERERLISTQPSYIKTLQHLTQRQNVESVWCNSSFTSDSVRRLHFNHQSDNNGNNALCIMGITYEEILRKTKQTLPQRYFGICCIPTSTDERYKHHKMERKVLLRVIKTTRNIVGTTSVSDVSEVMCLPEPKGS